MIFLLLTLIHRPRKPNEGEFYHLFLMFTSKLLLVPCDV